MEDKQNLGQTDKYVVAATKEKAKPKDELKTGKEVLNNTRVEELFLPIKMVQVTTDDSISHAFNLLVTNKILSVPMYDISRQRYTGFVDIADILHKILSLFPTTEIEKGLNNVKPKLEKIKCKDIGNVSTNNPYKPVESTAPLKAAIDLLLNYGARRVPIIDPSGALISVLSQSRIVEYLYQNRKKFSWYRSTVKELSLGYKTNTTTIPETMITKDAFELMQQKNISGVPVLDPTTHIIVGVLSNTDLKIVGSDAAVLDKMLLSVRDFVSLVQQQNPEKKTLPVVSPETTVRKVIKTLVSQKIHRMFVVEQSKILGVISLNDVLKLATTQQ